MPALEALTQLLFPTRCIGCKEIGIFICSTCRLEWHPHLYSTGVSTIPIYSGVIYSKTASKILLSAKENGLKGADELIIKAIDHVLSQCDFSSRDIRLVPIPSSRAARRRRGRNFMVDIAQGVGQLSGYRISDPLELIRKVRDQSGLHADARSENLRGAFGVKAGSYPRGDLVLIDDVVTTGSTLREAARALTCQGYRVVASVTACVAQPLR
jgi:predicted amidophosphoribosyltransferase